MEPVEGQRPLQGRGSSGNLDTEDMKVAKLMEGLDQKTHLECQSCTLSFVGLILNLSHVSKFGLQYQNEQLRF